MRAGFPTFLDRFSNKPGTSVVVTFCTGPPVLSFLSKALCFAFSYTQQKQLRQICCCCSLHNNLQNRSEPEQLLHKLGFNAQMKTRKQTNKTPYIVALCASPRDGLEEGCLLFLSRERQAGCQLLSLLRSSEARERLVLPSDERAYFPLPSWVAKCILRGQSLASL